MLQYVVPLIVSLQLHAALLDRDPERYRPPRCPQPQCGRAGLWAHGHYKRKVRAKAGRQRADEPAKCAHILVPRFRCRHCKHTCSSLPSCAAPRRWYIWDVQAAVLGLLLHGSSLNECARRFVPSRRTARRWWRWLQARHELLAFHLRSRWPDLGRASDWRELWQQCLAQEPLGEVMMWLARQGADVP